MATTLTRRKFIEAGLALGAGLAAGSCTHLFDRPASQKKATLVHFDRVLGLGLAEWQPAETVVPEEIQILVQQRQHARAAKQWQLADRLRGQISAAGYEIEDTPRGPQVQRATARELT